MYSTDCQLRLWTTVTLHSVHLACKTVRLVYFFLMAPGKTAMSHSAVVCGWLLYHFIHNCKMNKWMILSSLLTLCEQTFEWRCCCLDTLIVFLLSSQHNSASVLFISGCVVSRMWWDRPTFSWIALKAQLSVARRIENASIQQLDKKSECCLL